jgi:hypothetical protein
VKYPDLNLTHTPFSGSVEKHLLFVPDLQHTSKKMSSERVRAATQAMLVEKRRITPAEARGAMEEIMAGKSPNCQTAAFLAALQVNDDVTMV